MNNEKRKASNKGVLKETYPSSSPQKRKKRDANTNERTNEFKALHHCLKYMCKAFISKKRQVPSLTEFFVTPIEYSMEELFPSLEISDNKHVWTTIKRNTKSILSEKHPDSRTFIESREKMYDKSKFATKKSYDFEVKEAEEKNILE